ncbi:hypothetical protein [Paraburkholderia sacchari]|nr:hypothetical protein [Paraburkholderia sacchari]
MSAFELFRELHKTADSAAAKVVPDAVAVHGSIVFRKLAWLVIL